MDLQVTCVAQDFSDLPTDSIWTLIFPRLLEAIYTHNTTLIFVNNRRLAERVAAHLNELLTEQEHTFNNYAVPYSRRARRRRPVLLILLCRRTMAACRARRANRWNPT